MTGAQKLDNLVILAQKLGCETRLNEPLCNHTSFKVGGPCAAMIIISTANDVSQLISFCRNEEMPYLMIGNGSNLLCDDKGYNGVVFKFSDKTQGIELVSENEIKCNAGCMLSKASSFAMENSLKGFEFGWGIPGTVGGAVYMNAGAYGGEMKDIVKSVEIVKRSGEIVTVYPDENDFAYRFSSFQKNSDIISSVVLKLEKGDKAEIKAHMDELMKRRKEKQPLEYPSAGSTFKRPVGAFAAALIEQCGLKGVSVGDAEVSQKHSGFIINKGNATCADILSLIKIVHDTVLEKTGYDLECEVKIISSEG